MQLRPTQQNPKANNMQLNAWLLRGTAHPPEDAPDDFCQRISETQV
jgi:hypothetical protein